MRKETNSPSLFRNLVSTTSLLFTLAGFLFGGGVVCTGWWCKCFKLYGNFFYQAGVVGLCFPVAPDSRQRLRDLAALRGVERGPFYSKEKLESRLMAIWWRSGQGYLNFDERRKDRVTLHWKVETRGEIVLKSRRIVISPKGFWTDENGKAILTPTRKRAISVEDLCRAIPGLSTVVPKPELDCAPRYRLAPVTLDAYCADFE